jgi:hypothetical protein
MPKYEVDIKEKNEGLGCVGWTIIIIIVLVVLANMK